MNTPSIPTTLAELFANMTDADRRRLREASAKAWSDDLAVGSGEDSAIVATECDGDGG